jgi:hypothetical protein
MDSLKLSFYDGKRQLHIGPITSLDQLQGDNFTKMIAFFSESESSNFGLYLKSGKKELLYIRVQRNVSIDQLVILFSILYSKCEKFKQ